jgi:hypothetical protein
MKNPVEFCNKGCGSKRAALPMMMMMMMISCDQVGNA